MQSGHLAGFFEKYENFGIGMVDNYLGKLREPMKRQGTSWYPEFFGAHWIVKISR